MFSFFVTSSLPVYQNYIKNILFRIATLLIQLTIYKLFSFLASKSNAYTSFLMFNEDHVQKLLFVLSRGITRRSLLVLAFAVFFGFGNLYDTLLWALDSPGYVTKSILVTASSATDQLLANPTYIVLMSDPTKNPASLDVDQAVAGNLFVQGFNFTLPEPVTPGARDVVLTNQTLSDTVGPRIWLDDTGFSVGLDRLMTVTPSTICYVMTKNANLQIWNCKVTNTDALWLHNADAARPQIWWDNSSEGGHYLRPNRHDNPWASLSTGGNTAAMKQVFTVTKENRRHTFLQTVNKVTMFTIYPTPFDDVEITDIVRRVYSNDSSQPLTPAFKAIADVVIGAQANQTSLTMGTSQQGPYSVSSSRIELLNVVNSYLGPQLLFTALRLISTDITLIRSETLPNPVIPYDPADCQNFFTNIATGGKVHSSDCAIDNQTDARFLGQLDTSAVFILTDVLGDGSKSTSAMVLNQTGLDWYLRNRPHIDDLLIARGLILGGDRAAVPLAVQVREPAISYLQLILLLFAVLAFVVMMVVMVGESTGYYKNSFFAAVCATMHIDGRDGGSGARPSCIHARYLYKPPEIELVSADEHVVISTSGRVFTTVGNRDGRVVSDDELSSQALEPLIAQGGQSWREWDEGGYALKALQTPES